MKNVALPKSQIGKALDGNIMFDGSSIDGFVRINESDMYLKPDYNTFSVLPWRNRNGVAAARIICDVYKHDNTPFEGCPRVNLKRVLAEAKELGVHHECRDRGRVLPLRAGRERVADDGDQRCRRVLLP